MMVETTVTSTKRQYNRILVLAVETAKKQTANWRMRDRWEWIMARWPVDMGHECTGIDARACTDTELRPDRWCDACRTSAYLVAVYEKLAPPSWRVRSPDRATGPVVVRVKVDGTTPSGQVRAGQAQTTRLKKDGTCRACGGTGRATAKGETGRQLYCVPCAGTGGRRFER